MSTISYNDVVESLLKLHKCYRVQGFLSADLINKLDFFSKPRVALTIASLLWIINLAKRNIVGYSDIISMQRRVATFLAKTGSDEMEFLRKLLELAPVKLGLDIASTSRRCMIEYQKLVDVIRLLNLIKETLSLTTLTTHIQLSENLRKSRMPCLNDDEMLPSTNAIADTLTKVVHSELENVKELLSDPYFAHVMEVMREKIKANQLRSSDIVAFSLVILALLRQHKEIQICVEPGIDVETLCRKIYNDLTYSGTDPSSSDIYTLYQELSTRTVIRK
jgi:hypothetical protein